jgi:hypothetical protein
MNEKDSQFLHRQAEVCIALSRSTFDLTVAGRLRALAEEFRRKASEWDDEAAEFSPHLAGGNGSRRGQSSRD